MNGIFMKTKKQTLQDGGHSFRNKMAEASELPKDVVLGQPILTVLGYMELNIENYRGIIEYTDCLIRLQTKAGQVRVKGKALHIEYYTNDDMRVTGQIESIEYKH